MKKKPVTPKPEAVLTPTKILTPKEKTKTPRGRSASPKNTPVASPKKTPKSAAKTSRAPKTPEVADEVSIPSTSGKILTPKTKAPTPKVSRQTPSTVESGMLYFE